MTVYAKEKVAKSRTVALELLIKVGFFILVYLLKNPSLK